MMPTMMSAARHLARIPLRIFAGLFLVFALFLPALADEAADRAMADKAALDKLFVELKAAKDAETAHQIDQKIWIYWTTPSDPILALRMLDVMEARTTRGIDTTIKLLDQLVLDYPNYAEGWNQRATMLFAKGDYEASIADCARVLELEPRHFGALSGRAMMYLQMGKRSLALKDMAAALAIHPFLNERQLFPELQQQITRT
jgi:tetratricopeptide (TPR) repeat protein